MLAQGNVMMLMKTLMIISIQVSGFIKKEKTHPDSCLEKMFTTDYKIINKRAYS